jgi:hypothetical protein
MEMSDSPGSRRDLSSCISKDPPKVMFGPWVVSSVAQKDLRGEQKALGYTVELVPQRISATQEESDHRIIDRYNKCCVRFTSKIVIGKEIGKQIPIFENWIDRSTEEASLAANFTDGGAIVPSVSTDHERFDVHYGYPTTSFVLILGRKESSRRDSMKVAQQFIAGLAFRKSEPSRTGRSIGCLGSQSRR